MHFPVHYISLRPFSSRSEPVAVQTRLPAHEISLQEACQALSYLSWNQLLLSITRLAILSLLPFMESQHEFTVEVLRPSKSGFSLSGQVNS